MSWAGLTVFSDAGGSNGYTVDLRAGVADARCSAYADKAPIMAVSGPPGVDIMITPADRERVTDRELAFAREFAKAAARYLAECERFHVPDSAGNASGPAGRVA